MISFQRYQNLLLFCILLFERYLLEPSESIFVDDNADNVVGARNVGMHAVQFKNAAQLEQELKEVYGLEF